MWPGPRALTGNYLVTRLEPEPARAAAAGDRGDRQAGRRRSAPKTPEKPKNTATKNDEGAAGGKGEIERARDPNAKDDAAERRRKVALFEDKNRKVLDNIIDRNLVDEPRQVHRHQGRRSSAATSASATGTGTGVGDGTRHRHHARQQGHGTGGGGNVEGDFVSNKGKIDTGKERPGGGTCAKPPCGTGAARSEGRAVAMPSGDFAGLTAEEINRVVKARAGVFRACYQNELNRSPGLGGKLVVHFVIGGDGVVKSAKTAGGSTLRNAAVESCVTRTSCVSSSRPRAAMRTSTIRSCSNQEAES